MWGWQELVLIGIGMNEASLRGRLQDCLLTEEEMAQEMPGHVWPLMRDPWPQWFDEEEEEEVQYQCTMEPLTKRWTIK